MSRRDYTTVIKKLRYVSLLALLIGLAGDFALVPSFKRVMTEFRIRERIEEGTGGNSDVSAAAFGGIAGIVLSIPILCSLLAMSLADRKLGTRCTNCRRSVTGGGILLVVDQSGGCIHCHARVVDE